MSNQMNELGLGRPNEGPTSSADTELDSLTSPSNFSQSNVIELTSQKGSKKIAHCGYLYTKHSSRQNGEVRWRCICRSQKCPGVIHTSSDLTQVRVVSEHNHAIDDTAVD